MSEPKTSYVMSHLYAVAFSGTRITPDGPETRLGATAVTAPSKVHAVDEVRDDAHAKYPADEGWTVKIHAYEISDALVLETAGYFHRIKEALADPNTNVKFVRVDRKGPRLPEL